MASLDISSSRRYDYPAQFGGDIDTLVGEIREMLLGGRYILSAEVGEFERAFAAYVGGRFARGVNSGTDAIVIALLALGIGPGDEVITHANTFHATVAAIQLVGATPVLVDAEDDSFLMDVGQVPAALTSRTRVILPVHLYGKPTDPTELLRIAAREQLHLVEDAAQAHGAAIGGRRVGSVGIAGCFSFHPSKNLAAAGDAGAIVTDDAQLAARIDSFRALGQRGQNEHVVVGLNSKLDAIQAHVLSWKLQQLDAWNAARAQAAAAYRALLTDLPIGFQRIDEGETHVYHLFQIRTAHRDALLGHLQRHGVDAVLRYPTPIHLQPAFVRWGWQRGQFPVAERLAAELLCLPIRPDMHMGEIEYVCDTVRSFFALGRTAAH
jgi:dTDP-4-amino-4,6-dideoxygalactose transaminase